MYSTGAQTGPFSARIIKVEADQATERARRSCIRGMAVCNPADGCIFGCTFCPVLPRGRERETNEIRIRVNLPALLRRELTSRSRQNLLPSGVYFGTISDPFQPIEPLLEITHECMRAALESGVDVHFQTRGVVPESFGTLFRRFPGQVHAQVTLFSMDENLIPHYEFNTPRSQERIESIRRLIAWGVDVLARIEPLVPFVSDTAGHLEGLVRNLTSAGLTRASAAYLVLRPHMLELFQEVLPAAHYHSIKGSFKGQAWRTVGIQQMTKLLPERTRLKGYRRLQSIGARLGVEVTICACQNPSLGTSCLTARSSGNTGPKDRSGQLQLFQPNN
jgi:DNA repair photolyase